MNTMDLGGFISLFRDREFVVLDHPKGRTVLQLAIRPLDGDLDRLRKALLDAGVRFGQTLPDST